MVPSPPPCAHIYLFLAVSLAASDDNLLYVAAPWRCLYAVYGCGDPEADNYISYAGKTLSYMCQYGGCNDTDASNFDSRATYNNGNCTYLTIGCTVSAQREGTSQLCACLWVSRACVRARVCARVRVCVCVCVCVCVHATILCARVAHMPPFPSPPHALRLPQPAGSDCSQLPLSIRDNVLVG